MSQKGEDDKGSQDIRRYLINSSSSSDVDDDNSVVVHSISSHNVSPLETSVGKATPTSQKLEGAFIGSVGIYNEGTTCYLNSLLQLMFHINYFRSSVYRIPVENGKGEGEDVPVYQALQELFFQMQERKCPVRARRLTKAFGWGPEELLIQQDIQEMATLLRDNLEEKMKGTVTEGAINQIFVGCGEQVVETLDRSHVSRNRDIFYDIHLSLSDKTETVMDSLQSLLSKDKLVGDNKYRVEEEGKPAEYKDAEKGYEFKRFPPVAWFHIKRFTMDLDSPTLEMKKVNSRLEFPLELDLTELERGFTPEELADIEERTKRGEAVKSMITPSPAIYDLHGIIVHRGTVRSGHYYCYIRDWDSGQQKFTRWLEYDDDHVREVTQQTAMEANYGGLKNSTSGASAYILSYIRRADAPFIMAPSPTDIISQAVKDSMRKSIEEEEKRERKEKDVRQRVICYIISDRSISLYCQENQMDLFSRDCRHVHQFVECVLHFKKSDSLASVYARLEEEPSLFDMNIKKDKCRLWRWSSGRTFHPTTPLATYNAVADGKTLLSHILSLQELDRPLSMCLYVQTALPRGVTLSPTTAIDPLIQQFHREPDGGCRVRFSQPIRARSFLIYVDSGNVNYCRVKIKAIHSAASGSGSENGDDSDDGEELVLSCSIRDGIGKVSLTGEPEIGVELYVCCLLKNVNIVGIHFDVNTGVLKKPEPLKSEQLVQTGHDRCILFFKYFDHISCNTRYVGSLCVDRVATLGSLEGQLASMMRIGEFGMPNLPPRKTDGNFFAYYEEGKGGIQRELPNHVNLASCLVNGGIIVFQRRNVAPLYRHLTVDTYFNTLNSIVEIRLVEVRTHVKDNSELVTAMLESHAKIRDKIRNPDTPKLIVNKEIVNGSIPIADPDFDPYNTTLPVMNAMQLVVSDEGDLCNAVMSWTYETACDHIGALVQQNAQYLRLYRSDGEGVPSEEILRGEDAESLEKIIYGGNDYSTTKTVFYLRLMQPRAILEKTLSLVVTLRDAEGHALHRERYVLTSRERSLLRLIRAVKQSIQPWEVERDVWGTLAATLEAPHYILCAIDRHKNLIRRVVETLPPENGGEEEDVYLDSDLANYEFDLLPMAPLRPDEQRIVCCHGERVQESVRLFGHPFVITINSTTSVRQGLERMLKVTHIPREALGEESKWTVMILTDIHYHFKDWDAAIHLYWRHTRNASNYIPSLLIQHKAPREKPGSRYVAQKNPTLKISSN
ncbi:Ubiquitin carboxyl-terminal hydrolase/ICP0-binding domain of Ubiquitin-specific protease 7, putative [Angomonas deanei]|uniref:Ubiquitin carboxyl-terminal hydrolase/ICP0-binding domain of Ubiquitin-specific protease 7, putative n=1 Tax=Angomonas deanei TaxID=59799 RepID=A0A7G2CQB1_9TRYP|nr:Ubiquitin carboxyl-terminal hydrolase/ICP0-binding domain of Ubiquitin-specific protease 7, putative [Angomonas deanei]